MTRNCTWTVSNLCRGKPRARSEVLRFAIEPLGQALMTNTNHDILVDCCWALSYIIDGTKDLIEAYMHPPLLKRLIELVNHASLSVQIPIIRTIGNLTTGSDEQTQQVMDSGLLAAMLETLHHPKRSIRKECCWVLSNLTAGTNTQLQACIDGGIVDRLCQILLHDDAAVKMEAVWAMSNATALASTEQFMEMVDKGILKALCECLKAAEPQTVTIAIEGVHNILRCGMEHFTEAGLN